MLTLIPDLARVLIDANRRVTASVGASIQQAELEEGQKRSEIPVDLSNLRRRVACGARATTRRILAEAQEIEALWESAIESLREGFSQQEQIELLEVFVALLGSAQEALNIVGKHWELVRRLGGEGEATAELTAAGQLFARIHAEASGALRIRKTPWLPADPDRLERGLQELRDGQAVSAETARFWFQQGED